MLVISAALKLATLEEWCAPIKSPIFKPIVEKKEISVENFYVTTNLLVRYFNNKPLFYGSIAGVLLLVAMIIFLVVYKKKKQEAK